MPNEIPTDLAALLRDAKSDLSPKHYEAVERAAAAAEDIAAALGDLDESGMSHKLVTRINFVVSAVELLRSRLGIVVQRLLDEAEDEAKRRHRAFGEVV